MYILGISCYYHKSAASLIKHGNVIAFFEEEQFSKIKNDPSFPVQSINACLKKAKIKNDDLYFVVFYEKPFLKFERCLITSLQYFPSSLTIFVSSMKNFLTEKLWVKSKIAESLKINGDKILFVPHHLSHAAAAYYPSPFKKAAFLTLDGVGEWTTGAWGRCDYNKIYPAAEIRYPHSVGLLYSTFTAFLGLRINEGEKEVMDMASLGKAKHMDKLKKLYRQNNDGSIKLNLEYFSFYSSSKVMYSKKFVKEFAEVKSKYDLAASLQKSIEEIIFNMLKVIYKKTGERNLVYSGGVALNSLLNKKIVKKTPFKKVFIPKYPGDNGGAIGCALYVYNMVR